MKKYVIAGASSRGMAMFAIPLYESFSDCAEITAVYDVNIGRSQVLKKYIPHIRIYESFDEMVTTEKPDTVIVTTVDAYHSDYIIRAMELGCDVITEKPMTIDSKKCQAILDAEKKYGKKLTVTFNYRFAPYSTKIKEIIKSGAIGKVYSVHFEWMLDQVMDLGAHGTSYFRRWNSRMAKSGGLLVHKSTHHFDIINWWLDAVPEKVAAFGELNLYGAKNGKFKGERCETCEHRKECRYCYDLSDKDIEIYRDNEKYDGYMRDCCIYSDEIDIYDTMSVNVHYKTGELLSYSLNATTAYEGWRASINGSKGRLEAFLPETGVLSRTDTDIIKVFDLNNNVTEYKMTRVRGGHGGGDERLREMIFRGNIPDPLGHCAGSFAGTNSIMIGVAANMSIKDGNIVTIDDVIKR